MGVLYLLLMLHIVPKPIQMDSSRSTVLIQSDPIQNHGLNHIYMEKKKTGQKNVQILCGRGVDTLYQPSSETRTQGDRPRWDSPTQVLSVGIKIEDQTKPGN